MITSFIYSGRLGIVEKPIKRNEVCRPMLGPDGKYLYPCGYCSKTFCSASDLNRHMNFHEDVRPFKCEYCDYQSRTNSQLKVHMMRHAGKDEIAKYEPTYSSDILIIS
jgi:KRAB domain-containing zinc finger protein